MEGKPYQKKRRCRTDSENPYKTRYMVYSLLEKEGGGDWQIRVEQFDYVMKDQVAYTNIATPKVSSAGVGQMLIEQMLNRAKSVQDVLKIHSQWQEGNLPLIRENKNLLVEIAIKKRFARNLKRL
jgi:hypothetical protein